MGANYTYLLLMFCKTRSWKPENYILSDYSQNLFIELQEKKKGMREFVLESSQKWKRVSKAAFPTDMCDGNI